MDIADVLLQLELADEALAVALLLLVPVGNILRVERVDLTTYKPLTLMGGPDVRVEVRHAREPLVAAVPSALDRLALLDRGARVVHVDVAVQLGLATVLDIAEDVVDVLLAHMGL